MDINGIWGYEQLLGPSLHGELEITTDGNVWHARIAARHATATPTNDRIAFAFEDGSEYRGKVADEEIAGHWIQPPNITSGTAYATPLTLRSTGNSAWKGEVVPLDDRLELYLVINQERDGTLSAFIKDPERNAGLWWHPGPISAGSLARGESIRYDSTTGTISIELPDHPQPLAFTRRDSASAPGFYPRTSDTQQYAYRPPVAQNDGWSTGTLVEAGIYPEPIKALIEHILQTKTNSIRTPYIQGLLIARHSRLVLEEYFYGFDSERPHDMRSASKSLISPIIGIALDRRARFTLNTPACSLFTSYASFANNDPRKERITVEHLLTMASGLDCDDNDDDSPGNEDTMQNQRAQLDWYKYALDLPMAHEPGEQGAYCSAGINLLGGIIANATGTWLPEFVHEYIAGPLNFGRYHLNLTPLKDVYLGGGAYMRPRDFMKLGELFLRGGKWNGKQIVSKQWTEASWQPHSTLENHNYGYGWHLGEYSVAGRTYRRVEAGGNGGQFVIVVPDLDLVVMFTAANYGDYRTWSKYRDELVPQYIIPAVLYLDRRQNTN